MILTQQNWFIHETDKAGLYVVAESNLDIICVPHLGLQMKISYYIQIIRVLLFDLLPDHTKQISACLSVWPSVTYLNALKKYTWHVNISKEIYFKL